MPFASTILGIVFYEVHFDIRFAFLLELWKTTLMFEKSCEGGAAVFDRLFNSFRGHFLNPSLIRIVRNILVVEPHAKAFARHKSFAFFMQGFIIVKIEIVDVSASADSLINPDFLLGRWIYLRLEAL